MDAEEGWHIIVLLTIVYFNYIFNIPMLNESSQLVKIAALWKRKSFVTSSQATCVLPLVELALIHVHVFKRNWLMWLLTLYGMDNNGGVDWGWLHHWFKLDINYQLIHGSILQPFKTPCLYKTHGSRKCGSPSLVWIYMNTCLFPLPFCKVQG